MLNVKSELKSCCVCAGLHAVCEPYGLFGQFLPQQPLNRMEYRRTKVCLRPDFLFQLPMATGRVERRIADVKTVSLGAPSYYKPGAGGRRAVEYRDAEVPGEYRRTAAKMDTSLGQWAMQMVMDLSADGWWSMAEFFHFALVGWGGVRRGS